MARLYAGPAAALLVALALAPGPAGAKCAQESFRVSPPSEHQDVPLDRAILLELPAGQPVLRRLLRGDALQLLDQHGGAVALRPIRHSDPSPGVTPARITVELHPAAELRPDAEFRLDWQGWRDVPGPLRSYRFATGSRRSARLSEQPRVSTPAFWISRPGCGEQLAFSLDVLGADPAGVHEVQLAGTAAALSPSKPTRQAPLDSFLEIQRAGRLIIGATGCRSNHRFKARWRGWARVRVLAENGDPSPWSAPMELDADPDGPQAQRTCPPAP